MDQSLSLVVWLVVIVAAVVLFRRRRQRRGNVGPAAIGTMYDMLNEDRRKAVEIIVEEKAEARDPEDRDGNLPDLVDPTHEQSSGR